ncbi:unnamed protein product [Mytilus coruscus]|uniref:Death domain-containing protein n=1 Tax=Mytilus coruscus TaxID=42192 RepID=A0A6J8A0Z5_MYTCO|nr:unnamed protein product [Mytilus coruscus]
MASIKNIADVFKFEVSQHPFIFQYSAVNRKDESSFTTGFHRQLYSSNDSVQQEMLGLIGTPKQEIKRKCKLTANRNSFQHIPINDSRDIEKDTKQCNSEDFESKQPTQLEDIHVTVSASSDETCVKELPVEKENRIDVIRIKEQSLDQANGNSSTSEETKVKEWSSEQENWIDFTRVVEPLLDQANGNSTVNCFDSTEQVVKTNISVSTTVIDETFGGPHAIAMQPNNAELEERIRVLEKDNRLLKERMDDSNRNEKVLQFQTDQIQLAHAEHDTNIKALEQKFEFLQFKVQILENENQKLRQSMRFPTTVDEWLGISIQNIEKMVLNDKLVTYFSKALIPSHLGIIGEYFGFTGSEVCHIKHDTKDSAREFCRQLLKTWCNKKGETATIGALLRTLYEISQQEPTCIDMKSINEALKKANNSQIL